MATAADWLFNAARDLLVVAVLFQACSLSLSIGLLYGSCQALLLAVVLFIAVELLFSHYSSSKDLKRAAKRKQNDAILHHLTSMSGQLSALEAHHKGTVSTLKALSTIVKKQQHDYTDLCSQHRALQKQLQETRAEAEAALQHAAGRDKAADQDKATLHNRPDGASQHSSAHAMRHKADSRADAGAAGAIPTVVTHTPGHSEHATPASTPQHPPATRPAAAGSHAPVTSSTSRQPPASASQYPVSGYVVSTCLGGGWLTGDLQPAGPAPQAGCNVMAASPLVHGAAAAGSPASVSKGPRAPSHGSPCAGGAVASPGAPQAEAASNDSAAAKSSPPAAHTAAWSPGLVEAIKREINSPQHSAHT